MNQPMNFPPPGGAPYYSAPPPPAPPAPKRAGTLILGVIGGLVIALVAGAVLYFSDVISFGEGRDVDTAPIALPDTVNGLRPFNDVNAELSGNDQPTPVTEFNTLTETKLTEVVSQAYNGAASVVRVYSDEELDYRPTIIAVRAASPGLFLPQYSGPEALERLQLAELPQEVIVQGEVQCQVFRVQTTLADEEIDPANTKVTVCQRTDTDLTVRIYGGGTSDQNSVESSVALISTVWDSLTSDTSE